MRRRRFRLDRVLAPGLPYTDDDLPVPRRPAVAEDLRLERVLAQAWSDLPAPEPRSATALGLRHAPILSGRDQEVDPPQ